MSIVQEWKEKWLATDKARQEALYDRDEAHALLRRIVTYAREDRARTPGSTRLARALLQAERLLPRFGDQIAPDTAEPAEKQPDSR